MCIHTYVSSKLCDAITASSAVNARQHMCTTARGGGGRRTTSIDCLIGSPQSDNNNTSASQASIMVYRLEGIEGKAMS